MLHTTLTISPSIATAGRHHRVCVAISRRPHPHLLESGLPRSPSLAHHPWCQRHGPSLRWIRAKESAIFAGKQVGGELRYQRKECLDVRWWDLGKIEVSELAFGGDRKAILMWRGMKAGQVEPEYDLRGFRG